MGKKAKNIEINLNKSTEIWRNLNKYVNRKL